jgi:multicomponent Na+:H+ antiporter subunit D
MWAWLVLEVASAGVFLHAGIKFPYFVFFAKDKGLRPGETNKSMLIAMGFLSFLCIFLGVYPQPLYHVLPFEVHYQAYTFNHVIAQLQLLMFSGLVFFLFLPLLKRTETISIDTDWFYRKGLSLAVAGVTSLCCWVARLCNDVFIGILPGRLGAFSKRPISALVTSYMRATGEDGSAVKAFGKQTPPEAATFTPMGVPVVISLVFLFSLVLVFAFFL